MAFTEGTHTTDELKVFRQYFDLYYNSIRSYIYFKSGSNDLADDLVQEVFVKLWEMRQSLKPDLVKPLLYTIALNLLRNHIKHQKVVYGFEKKQTKIDSGTESADFNIEQEEFNQKLNAVMEKIPEKSREVFLMNRIDDLSYNHIAERLGLSVKTIEKRMHEALGIIRKNISYKI